MGDSESEDNMNKSIREMTDKKFYFRHLDPATLENEEFINYIKSVGLLSEHLENSILFDPERLKNQEIRRKIVENINSSSGIH